MDINNAIGWSKIDAFSVNRSKDINNLTHLRSCPICGSKDHKPIHELSNFQFYCDSIKSSKRVTVRQVICQNCFALYLNPCYSDYGFKILMEEAGRSFGSSEGRPKEQIEWLKNHGALIKGNSLMDVGCYEGEFLAQLPDNILKLGVDIDLPAIERGQLKFNNKNIEFFHGDFETFQFSGSKPDTITMFHVLEHLPRPVDVLKKLHSVSQSTTNLVVEVPILENSLTNDICGFFGAHHTTHFSKKSLENCLQMSGWELKEAFEHPEYNGYRILARPRKAKLDNNIFPIGDPNDIDLVNEYLENWFEELSIAEEHLKIVKLNSNIIIWGGGMHTEFLYQNTSFFNENKNSNFIIVDSDESKHDKTWRGLNIYSPLVLNNLNFKNTALVVSSYGGQESIILAAKKIGVPEDRIFKIYDEIRIC